MTPLLLVRDLSVAFRTEGGVVEAVRGVSFDVPMGRTVALVGESGAGKTAIGQAILGILPRNARITGGRILFSDPAEPGVVRDLAALRPDDPERRRIRGGRIAMVFQEPMSSLSPLHTIGDQVGEALAAHGRASRAEVRERTLAMLAKVGFPDPERAYRAYPFELSGGLRQRAVIAMALVCAPALLIADEPTTALDVTIQAQILKLLADLQRELGIAILFITHDLGVVANMAHGVVVLYRGRVVERGPTRALFTAPRHPYLQGLLRAVPRLHTPADRPLVPLRRVPSEAGALLRRSRVRAPLARPRGPILEVEGLRKTFRLRRGGWLRPNWQEIVAVDDVGFTVERGECLALVGESGCGKTTVSRLVVRALSADRGRVIFHGRDGPIDVFALDERELAAFRRAVQYVFQDPFGSLNPRMTVRDIVAEPLVIHRIGTREEREERVKALLAAVGLEPQHLSRYPHSFSGGQRQRIGIARALALEPELLILDEPVSALDVSVQAQILNLLKDLKRELELTYLFISHNLAVVKYIADRIAVMCAGKLVELAPTAELFAAPRHPYTCALLAVIPEPDP
ncbi:MAG: ABC transporter ATP-binding protein, partial [Geminicoccaceae bacterium]|nr:ABC transporter ATP-binding protein [Geminicoccaceae bacterium]